MKTTALVWALVAGSLPGDELCPRCEASSPSGNVAEENAEARRRNETFFRVLTAFAEDPKRGGEERIEAILKIGDIAIPEATDYLLENIALEFTKIHFRGDADELMQRPCFYALRRRGAAVFPVALEFLRQARRHEQLVRIGSLMESVAGADKTRQLLEKERIAAKNAPYAGTLAKNIDVILTCLDQAR